MKMRLLSLISLMILVVGNVASADETQTPGSEPDT